MAGLSAGAGGGCIQVKSSLLAARLTRVQTLIGLYPLFLIGAAVGLLLATFMLIPAYGIIRTLLWVSSLTLMMLIPFCVIKFKK
jgi:hypothetical protein